MRTIVVLGAAVNRFLIITLVLACGSKTTTTPPPAAEVKAKVSPAQALAALQSKDIPHGLDLRLSRA